MALDSTKSIVHRIDYTRVPLEHILVFVEQYIEALHHLDKEKIDQSTFLFLSVLCSSLEYLYAFHENLSAMEKIHDALLKVKILKEKVRAPMQ